MVLYPTVTQGKKCRSAINQLIDYNRDYGQFVAWERALNATNHAKWFYAHYQSVAPLRKGDPSAVIIFPTNAAFMKWLGKNNIHSDPSRWTRGEIKLFRKASMAMVVPWRVARRRWPKYFTGCTLLGLTHDLNFPLQKMGLDLWGGKGPGLTGSLLPQKTFTNATQGRRLQGAANPGFFYQDYSIAGTGYNTLTGFPLQFTGNDPGITGNSVFNTGKGGISVATVQNYATCGINFATTTYYTAAQLQGAAITSLQLPSRYASAAFSQNSDYGSLANNMATNHMITLVQDSIVTGGGWNLGPITSSTNPLDSNYVMAVNNLAMAKLNGSSSYNTLLSNLANSYGSTYVQQVWWGGYTSTVLQYSASKYASMQQAGVSLSNQALGLFYSAGGYIITSGCFPYDTSAISTAFQDASAYRVMQVPYASSTTNTLSAIPVSSSGPAGSTYSTGCSGGSIDCTGWTQNILAQETQLGIQAPNSYFLGDQYTLLTTYPNLFDPSVSSVLPDVASDLANLFSKCQSLAPCPAPNSCPPQPASFAVSCGPDRIRSY
jgi:hypothetical protein